MTALPSRAQCRIATPRSRAHTFSAVAFPRSLAVGVRRVVGVPARAMRFDSVGGWRRNAPAHVDPRTYWLQVCRSNAAANPAQVVELQPFGDWPNDSFVGPAMGHGAFMVNEELSVSTGNEVSRPQPTIAQVRSVDGRRATLINSRPEPLFDRDARCHTASKGIAVAPPAIVVALTPSTRYFRLFAAINRASRIVMHRVTSGVARQGVLAPLPLSIVPSGGGM